MNTAVVLQIAVPAAIAVAGAGWAIIRYELGRYAKAHPTAPLVKDAEAVIAEARAVAPLLGVTATSTAGFLAGALAHAGHPVSAKVILATEQAVAAAATADLARTAAPVVAAPQAVTLTPATTLTNGPAAQPAQDPTPTAPTL